MKNSERLQQAQALGRCAALVEQMNTRLGNGGRNWQEKQQADWLSLRQICNQQIAKAELLDKPSETPEQPPLALKVAE